MDFRPRRWKTVGKICLKCSTFFFFITWSKCGSLTACRISAVLVVQGVVETFFFPCGFVGSWKRTVQWPLVNQLGFLPVYFLGALLTTTELAIAVRPRNRDWSSRNVKTTHARLISLPNWLRFFFLLFWHLLWSSVLPTFRDWLIKGGKKQYECILINRAQDTGKVITRYKWVLILFASLPCASCPMFWAKPASVILLSGKELFLSLYRCVQVQLAQIFVVL